MSFVKEYARWLSSSFSNQVAYDLGSSTYQLKSANPGIDISRERHLVIENLSNERSNMLDKAGSLILHSYGFPLELRPGVYEAHPDYSYSSGILIDNLPSDLSGKKVLDVGCGAGVIALSAAYRHASSVIACDYSSQALDLSWHNIYEHNPEHRNTISLLQSDVLADVKSRYPYNRFDIVAANLWFPKHGINDENGAAFHHTIGAYYRLFDQVRDVMTPEGIVMLTSADFAATGDILDAMALYDIEPHITTVTKIYHGNVPIEWRLYSFDRDGKPADPAQWRQKNLENTPSP